MFAFASIVQSLSYSSLTASFIAFAFGVAMLPHFVQINFVAEKRRLQSGQVLLALARAAVAFSVSFFVVGVLVITGVVDEMSVPVSSIVALISR